MGVSVILLQGHPPQNYYGCLSYSFTRTPTTKLLWVSQLFFYKDIHHKITMGVSIISFTRTPTTKLLWVSQLFTGKKKAKKTTSFEVVSSYYAEAKVYLSISSSMSIAASAMLDAATAICSAPATLSVACS